MVHINHKSCPLILQLKKNSLLVFITPTLMHSMHTKATKNQHGDMEITTSVNKVEGNGGMLNYCTHKAKNHLRMLRNSNYKAKKVKNLKITYYKAK